MYKGNYFQKYYLNSICSVKCCCKEWHKVYFEKVSTSRAYPKMYYICFVIKNYVSELLFRFVCLVQCCYMFLFYFQLCLVIIINIVSCISIGWWYFFFNRFSQLYGHLDCFRLCQFFLDDFSQSLLFISDLILSKIIWNGRNLLKTSHHKMNVTIK